MSIIEETRIALLVLFPEQAAADAEARALAEAEAEEAALAVDEAEVETAVSEMESMELTPDEAEKQAEEVVAEADAAKDKKAKKEKPEKEEPRVNGVLATDHAARGTAIDVLCTPEQVVDAARIMDEQKFFLESITGVDWNKDKKLEVIYDYNQYGPAPCRVAVRTLLDRDAPEIATISDIHPSANWHERETHDFYGIKFQGHPHLIPILLPEDADFHPLLKDYKP
jgi:NADH-quinone oxidoreductase subunit C